MDSNLWKDITSAALLGTERQSFKSIVTSGKLGEILQLDETRSPESVLLLSAGILSLYQQAGQQPQKNPIDTFMPCDLNDQPRCCPRAASFLQSILQSGSNCFEHLPEWLEIAAQKGQRAPEQYLPRLLTLAANRQQILPVLGQRGLWLAMQNPEWNIAIDTLTEIDWDTSDERIRLVYLRQLRPVQPDRARELLQSTWKEESAEMRTQFLTVLQIELSMADEPFLEEQLNDRSKTVRRKAADLLVCLPDSRYCDRMIQRLAPLIQLEEEALRITVPSTCDRSMQRDGIELKPPNNSRYGEKAWWLLQLIAATPLKFWQAHLGLADISSLIEYGKASEWATVLQEGWQQATKAQKNAEWAEVLLNYPQLVEIQNVRSLLALLQPEQRDRWLCQLFERTSRGITDYFVVNALQILGSFDSYWSEELVQHVLQSVSTHISEYKTYPDCYELDRLLKVCTLRIPRGSIPRGIIEFESMIKDDLITLLQESVKSTIAILKFRQDMIQSFEN